MPDRGSPSRRGRRGTPRYGWAGRAAIAAVLALVAIMLADTHVAAFFWRYPGFGGDEAAYFDAARRMAAMHTLLPLREFGHLTSMLWTVAFLIVGPSIRAALTVNLLAVLLSAMVLERAMARFGASAPVRAAGLALGYLHPTLWQYTALYSEPVFLLTVAIWIWSLSVCWTPRLWWLTGLTVVLPFHARIVWAGVVPAYGLAAWWARPSGATWRHWTGLVLAAALAVAPALWLRWRYLGDPWYLKTNHFAVWTSAAAQARVEDSSRPAGPVDRLREWAGRTPDFAFAWQVSRGVFGLVRGSPLPAVTIVGLGMLATSAGAARAVAMTGLWWMAFTCLMLSMSLGVGSARFYMPFAVMLAPLALAGAEAWVRGRLGARGRAAFLAAAVLTAAWHATAYLGWADYVYLNNKALGRRQEMFWMVNRALDYLDPSRTVPIMCSNFYGDGRPAQTTPDGPPALVFERAPHPGFYLTHGWHDDRLPVNQSLWEGGMRPPGDWRLIYEGTRPERMRLYGIGRGAPRWVRRWLRDQLPAL